MSNSERENPAIGWLVTIGAIAVLYFMSAAFRPSSHLEPILDDPTSVGWLRGWSKDSFFAKKKEFRLKAAGPNSWYVVREGKTQPEQIYNLNEIGIYSDEELANAADDERAYNGQ